MGAGDRGGAPRAGAPAPAGPPPHALLVPVRHRAAPVAGVGRAAARGRDPGAPHRGAGGVRAGARRRRRGCRAGRGVPEARRGARGRMRLVHRPAAGRAVPAARPRRAGARRRGAASPNVAATTRRAAARGAREPEGGARSGHRLVAVGRGQDPVRPRRDPRRRLRRLDQGAPRAQGRRKEKAEAGRRGASAGRGVVEEERQARRARVRPQVDTRLPARRPGQGPRAWVAVLAGEGEVRVAVARRRGRGGYRQDPNSRQRPEGLHGDAGEVRGPR